MCNAASFVVTINDIFHSMSPQESESHERIMKQHGIVNDEHEIRGVAVEITPPGYDFSLPFDKWKFQIDQDKLPEWFNAQEVEIACREKLPLWKELHTIKDGEECEIGGDDDDYCYGLVFEGSPKIKVNRYGRCYTYNNSSPNVKVNECGSCNTYNNSSPNVKVNECGSCNTYNNSSPNVKVNKYGLCYIHDNSFPTVIVNKGGGCYTLDESSSIVIVNKDGKCHTWDESSPIVVVNKGGECRTWGKSKPNVTLNKGGKCEECNSTAKIIYNK